MIALSHGSYSHDAHASQLLLRDVSDVALLLDSVSHALRTERAQSRCAPGRVTLNLRFS